MRCAHPSSRLAAGLLSLSALVTPGLAQDVAPVAPFADAVHGADAVARLGDRLPALAAAHGSTAAELTDELLRDDSLWVTDDERLVFVDPAAPAQFQGDVAAAYAGTIPLGDAFTLHSNPGAKKVIYLDFDGHHSKNNGWGHNIQFPAWNTSGSSSSFSNGELQSIINHWLYVVEDFSSWEVDVTTEDPGEDALTRFLIGDDEYGVRCVMTQITSGFGSGSGGIAILGSFGGLQDTPVFVFNKGDNTGSMSASHEVGHALGLSHDGLNGSAYHPGTGSGATSWGPIMGAPFGATVVHWSSGDYAGATTNQLDVSIIKGNALPWVADDFADTVAAPSPLPVSCPDTSLTAVEGLLGRDFDVDALSFNTTGGTVSVTVSTHPLGPNVDVLLELYTAGGALLASDNPSNQTSASLSQSVGPGTYVVRLEGVGKPGVYSDYGSLGAYTLTVSAPAGSSFQSVGSGTPGTGGLVPVLSGTGVACEGNAVSTTLSQALPGSTAYLTFGVGQLNVPFKGGVLIPNIGLGGFVALAVPGTGTLSVPTTWPAGIPAAIEVDFQYWVQDPGAFSGFASSNGLALLTP